ncbi:MAG: radical SAM protein, partial [Desulfobacterota bacterium]|nr:radical SAM protein [Thermodesulfobacteriota bacterium]
MPLGSKWDYVYCANLRPSRTVNVLKSIVMNKRGQLPYYPRRYMIEPTTMCNLKCRHCFHWRYDKEKHFIREHMSFENFQIILDKIKPFALLIELYNYGEPFLNKDTPRMIAAATRAGIRTRISSNMSVPMTNDYARDIVQAGLYRLTCSLDGPTQEIYERYRIGGNLSLALENAVRIIQWKKKLNTSLPIVVFRMLVFEWNHHTIDQTRQLAERYGFDEFYADPGSYTIDGEKAVWDIPAGKWKKGKTRFLEHPQRKHSQKPCEWLFHAMVINANGNVIPCCFPYERSAEHLSLLTHSLDEVWNSQQYIATRLYTLGLSSDRSAVLSA